MDDLAAYLRRLGYDAAPPPTLETLIELHRAHLDAIPYDNIDIMVGSPVATDAPSVLAHLATTGRAGYCFHHNAALGALLDSLGFHVVRRHGQVWSTESELQVPALNHLVLEVVGLPTSANPSGRWWADVGLGIGFREPLPVLDGEHRQDFTYRISRVGESGWDFGHRSPDGFQGVAARSRPLDVEAAHERLSGPGGRFARFPIVQHRVAGACVMVVGAVATRLTPTAVERHDLATYAEWRAALDSAAASLDDVPESALRGLWERTLEAHQEWVAAGRP